MARAVVVGSGPAGLMAADVLASASVSVTICDSMPSFGRKFLMAGKSGLNLTKAEPIDIMLPHFGKASHSLEPMLKAFDAESVRVWARGLGQELFTGPTGRVFPNAMKASPLLRAWMQRLADLGVDSRTRLRWMGWQNQSPVFQSVNGREVLDADVMVLALGGASWSRLGADGAWQSIFAQHDIQIAPFGPSNAAVDVSWSDHMTSLLGQPLKACEWRAGGLTSRGEAILSSKGLEGGGMYALTPALREAMPLYVDLVPDKNADRLAEALAKKSKKARLSHWLKSTLRLPAPKVALFLEMTAGQNIARNDWVPTVKNLRVHYNGLRPMDEAISTTGGLRFDDLTSDLMLKARPGVFCAGEMLDWEAPTGGYLITGCLATGRWAGQGALRYLEKAA